MPKISIIIPCYKTEKFLDKCLDSVVNQTLTDIEIILVDDESPDHIPQMCDEWAQKDTRIKVIHKKNEGLGLARNAGIKIASGEFIAFLDSDDIVNINTYQFCYDLAIKEGADEIRFLFSRFTNENSIENNILNENYILYRTPEKYIIPLLSGIAPIQEKEKLEIESTCSSCTALYRSKIIKDNNIQFLSERQWMSEDYIFNILYAYSCKSIIFTNNIFYHYRETFNSLTRTVREDRMEKCIKFSHLLDTALSQHAYPHAKVFSMGYVIEVLRAHIEMIMKCSCSLKKKKKLFLQSANLVYLQEIKEKYPIKSLPIYSRICLHLTLRKAFYLYYLIIILKNTFKKK